MKYLAVDLGNVIVDVNFDSFTKALSKAVNLSPADVINFLSRIQRLQDLGLTEISSEMIGNFKIESPFIIQDLMQEWDETIQANLFMNSFLREAMQDNVKIALLSNIGTEHAALMPEVLTNDVYDYSIKFFSCQVGARKPSYLYYKTFLDMYPDFKGCVYLDDRIENIETGKIFGFDAQQFVLDGFKSPSDLVDAIDKIKNQLK